MFLILRTAHGGRSPADTRRRINVDLTLVHRLRRWTNGKPTLIPRLVSAGRSPVMSLCLVWWVCCSRFLKRCLSGQLSPPDPTDPVDTDGHGKRCLC